MLKNIDKLLTGDLLKALCDMGHGDTVAIVDANYPAKTMNKNVISLPGIKATDVLEIVLKYLPIDHIDEYPILVMNKEPQDKDMIIKIYDDFNSIIHNEDSNYPSIHRVSRQDFYNLSKESYLIIQTGEERLYGDILLKKGPLK